MTPEDKLKDLLRNEAQTIVPAGDGLAKIQQRLVRRRRLRLFVLPGAALATAGATAAFFLLGGGAATHTLVEQPGGQTPSPVTATAAPTPSNNTGVPVPTETFTPALWPFSSAAQVAAWRRDPSAMPWAGSSVEVAKHFVSDYLKLAEVGLIQSCSSCDVFGIELAGTRVGELTLVREDGGKRAYSVYGVTGTDLVVSTPKPEAAITSPTAITGRITGVDENVRLRLITSAGKEIATAGAPAGSAVPWQGTLTWSDTGWSTAGIVATTYSSKDGALTRLVVVPVSRATGGPSFVGLVDGHVSLLDATTGAVLRQLTYPPAGKDDFGAAWASGTLAWVRRQDPGCVEELDRLDNGIPSTVVKAGTVHLGTPRLSASGGWLAWSETPCDGSAASLVVSGGGAPDRRITIPSSQGASIDDVRDDGSVLVQYGITGGYQTRLLTPTATSADGGVELAPKAGCDLGTSAFDGDAPVAWEKCSGGSTLVRFSPTGARVSTGPQIKFLEAPTSVSVRAGSVLVWLFGGDTVGEIATYKNGTLTVVVHNTGCTSVSEPKGCVRAPDW